MAEESSWDIEMLPEDPAQAAFVAQQMGLHHAFKCLSIATELAMVSDVEEEIRLGQQLQIVSGTSAVAFKVAGAATNVLNSEETAEKLYDLQEMNSGLNEDPMLTGFFDLFMGKDDKNDEQK